VTTQTDQITIKRQYNQKKGDKRCRKGQNEKSEDTENRKE
jgi:hypothetical protein